MLDNAIQHYWKLVVDTLLPYRVVARGCMHFVEGGNMFINAIQQL